jgi:hypothetical protein
MAFFQTSVANAPAIALAGELADNGYSDKVSRSVAVACEAGLFLVGDEKTCEPPDSAADVRDIALGLALRVTSKVAATPHFAVDDTVSLLRTGRGWVTLLSGAAPQHGDPVYVYRGVTAADRGKATQNSAAGSVTRLAGARFTGLTASGIAEVQLDGVGDRVEAATEQGVIPISLFDWREVDANTDVGNIVANGGILASDTTPILRGNVAETLEISWAAANVDPIAVHLPLPLDFDGSADVTVQLWVNSGATNAATMTVETGWDGGALVSDSASDVGTNSATTHMITATIAAADIPDAASFATLILTPPTHATDAIQLLSARLIYQRA